MAARSAGFIAVLLLLLAGCGTGTGDGGSALEAESILAADLPGTANGKTSIETGKVTRLYDVTGDWVAVSVAIAERARAEGWTIEAINCVGTGNDVIARKRVAGRWLLLESGAGTRGAGLILSVAANQDSPGALRVTGSCPAALRTAAGG